MSDEKQVYKAINAVQADLCKQGITKDSENTFDHYKFRGIDAVYNALSPLLAKHGLCVLPRFISRDCVERVSKEGGKTMNYVTVEGEFDFVAASDGSTHTVRTFGEAMDRSDKATNKAMSAAYKYAAFQTFAIPTEGDNDADASTPEAAAQEPQYTPPPTAKGGGIVAEVRQLAEIMGFDTPDIRDASNHKFGLPFGKLDDEQQRAFRDQMAAKAGCWKQICTLMDAEHGGVPDGLTEAEKADRAFAYIKEKSAAKPFDGKPLRAPAETWNDWVIALENLFAKEHPDE